MNPKKLLTCLLACALGSGGLNAAVSEIVYDYIIVGNGTAGSVLARKLSDNKKNKVLVLEAGVNLDDDTEVLQSAVLNGNYLTFNNDLFYSNKYSFNYTVPVYNPVTFPAGFLQTVSASTGRGWGGSSMHNFMDAVRGTPSIYNQWATLSGNSLWSYNNLLPMMRALENYTPDQTMANLLQRGSGGPISITQTNPLFTAPPPFLIDAFAALFAAPTGAGCGFIVDYNDPTEISTNVLGIPTGLQNVGMSAYQIYATPGSTPGSVTERSFSSKEFLTTNVVSEEGMGVKKRLLRIESNATVSRVIFNKKKAVGVEFFYGDNSNQMLQAFGKQIILAAGALATPAILQRSGIGDATVLEPLGIDVIYDNPNVGANLQNQYGVAAVVVNTTSSFTAQYALQGFWNGSTGGGLSTPYPNDSVRRLQFLATPIDATHAAVLINILSPSSRGTVQIVSSNPSVPPNIDLNMYSDGPGGGGAAAVGTAYTDANLAVSAYKILANSVGGTGNVVFPSAAQYAVAGDQGLFQAAQSPEGLTIQDHYCGTASMALSSATGVVDGNLNVFGVKNLMVADLSAAPIIPDGNTCYSAYMIGLGAAAILGESTPPAL